MSNNKQNIIALKITTKCQHHYHHHLTKKAGTDRLVALLCCKTNDLFQKQTYKT